MLAQAGDHEGADGDAQRGGVDDGAVAADGAAALQATDAAEHGGRRQTELAREREVGHASVLLQSQQDFTVECIHAFPLREPLSGPSEYSV